MKEKEAPFSREPAEGGRQVIDKELAKMKDKSKPAEKEEGEENSMENRDEQ